MIRRTWHLVKATATAWQRDGAAGMGAALAFYGAFSLAPLLVVAVGVLGIALGSDQAMQVTRGFLRDAFGEQSTPVLEAMFAQTRSGNTGWAVTAISAITVLIGATSLFVELENSLNRIWNAPRRLSSGWINFLRTRALSLLIVFASCFVMLLSLISTTLLATLAKNIDAARAFGDTPWHLLNVTASLALTTFLFALIFKWLTNARFAWRDVWIGAAVTSILFNFGRAAIGYYLGRTAIASVYGAAGAFAMLLLWMYYSAQVFLLGAEFLKVFVARRKTVPNAATRST